uniref:NADH-ubiquinone oxidoreductase chain 4 n=1 Tax=Chloroparvula japonica TaxID=1411623 RepID=A0A4D6C4Z5_9CHLO|nr:NADH dehydrogenase subunit 4 [Chloroparvula japonica]QBX98772.1 NADH dehydrogenase subunit 4 [Chloroparvula japonica]
MINAYALGFWGLTPLVLYNTINLGVDSGPMLAYLIMLPMVGALVLMCTPSQYTDFIKLTALNISLLSFVMSLFLWVGFDASTPNFQYMYQINWLPFANLHLTLGIDGISLFFVILTTLLIPICLLAGWSSITKYVREYFVAFLILESLMLAVFCTLDLLLFYVFFESVLLPMFIIIGVWGSRERKIRAAYQFFLYTLLGSVLMLLAILMIYFQAGTTDLQVLLTTEFSTQRQILYWLAFFASFAVKVPMVPVHIWLPEAHVEAPTAGSVILAGILLKLGTYGFLRFSIPMFPEATLYFTPLIYTMSVIAIIYTSLTTIRQVDLKKIIAYSSVAHMNVVTLGMFSLNAQGVEGSLLLMLGHGLVSPALFLCIGALYDRHKTRLVKYYGGLVHTMPVFATIFLFFTMGNIGLPGTSNFVGEFLVLTGCFQTNTLITALAATGMVLGAAYSLWLYNRVVFGFPKTHYISVYADLNRREFFMFVPLVVGTLWMGVYPEIFLHDMHASVGNLIHHGTGYGG